MFLPHHAFLERSEVRNDGPWSLALQTNDKDNGWLQIRSHRQTFTMQRQDHSMPNWRLVVPESRTATVVFGEKATAFLIEVLPKLPGKDDPHRPIRLGLVDQSLLATAAGESTPQATTFPVEDAVVTGDNLTITVDRTFALRHRLKAAGQLLAQIRTRYDTMEEALQPMARVQINASRLTEYLTEVFQASDPTDDAALIRAERNREWAEHFFDEERGNGLPSVRGTLWAAFNGVIELLDHRKPRQSPHQRLTSLWFDHNYRLKAKGRSRWRRRRWRLG